MFLAFVVYWAFRDIGRTGSLDIRSAGFQEQMSNTRVSFEEHPRLWGIMAVAGLRGMANVAFLPFLALYLGLDDELGLGNASSSPWPGADRGSSPVP